MADVKRFFSQHVLKCQTGWLSAVQQNLEARMCCLLNLWNPLPSYFLGGENWNFDLYVASMTCLQLSIFLIDLTLQNVNLVNGTLDPWTLCSLQHQVVFHFVYIYFMAGQTSQGTPPE